VRVRRGHTERVEWRALWRRDSGEPSTPRHKSPFGTSAVFLTGGLEGKRKKESINIPLLPHPINSQMSSFSPTAQRTRTQENHRSRAPESNLPSGSQDGAEDEMNSQPLTSTPFGLQQFRPAHSDQRTQPMTKTTTVDQRTWKPL